VRTHQKIRAGRKGEDSMEPKVYCVVRIEGEYAILKNEEDGGEVFIALALLPAGTDLGVRLRYECFEYTIL